MKQQKSLLLTLALVSILGGVIFGVQHRDVKWGLSFNKNLNKKVSVWKDCVQQFAVECSDNTITSIDECLKTESEYLSCYQNEPSCQIWESFLSKKRRTDYLLNEMYDCALMCESAAEQDSFYYKDIFLVKYSFCTE